MSLQGQPSQLSGHNEKNKKINYLLTPNSEFCRDVTCHVSTTPVQTSHVASLGFLIRNPRNPL